jgi:hypothetical protein
MNAVGEDDFLALKVGHFLSARYSSFNFFTEISFVKVL